MVLTFNCMVERVVGDFFEEYEELKKLQSFRTKITIFLEFVLSGNVFFFFFFFS